MLDQPPTEAEVAEWKVRLGAPIVSTEGERYYVPCQPLSRSELDRLIADWGRLREQLQQVTEYCAELNSDATEVSCQRDAFRSLAGELVGVLHSILYNGNRTHCSCEIRGYRCNYCLGRDALARATEMGVVISTEEAGL